jgi:hypothetical protein
LDRPEWTYLFDVDPEATVKTRRAVLENIEREDAVIACGHYPGGIGGVERDGSHTVWRPAV